MPMLLVPAMLFALLPQLLMLLLLKLLPRSLSRLALFPLGLAPLPLSLALL